MGRAKPPGTRLHLVTVGRHPAVDEACDVLAVSCLREGALQVDGGAYNPGADIAGMDVEARREVDLLEEVSEARHLLPVELHVVEMLAGADFLLVPRAVAEHEAVQDAESVRLRAALRENARGRYELP